MKSFFGTGPNNLLFSRFAFHLPVKFGLIWFSPLLCILPRRKTRAAVSPSRGSQLLKNPHCAENPATIDGCQFSD